MPSCYKLFSFSYTSSSIYSHVNNPLAVRPEAWSSGGSNIIKEAAKKALCFSKSPIAWALEVCFIEALFYCSSLPWCGETQEDRALHQTWPQPIPPSRARGTPTWGRTSNGLTWLDRLWINLILSGLCSEILFYSVASCVRLSWI